MDENVVQAYSIRLDKKLGHNQLIKTITDFEINDDTHLGQAMWVSGNVHDLISSTARLINLEAR